MAHTAIRIWIPGACHRVISPITLGGNKVTTDKRTFRKDMHPVQWGRRGRSARCAPPVLASPTTHPILPPPAHQPTAVWWRSTAQRDGGMAEPPGAKEILPVMRTAQDLVSMARVVQLVKGSHSAPYATVA